MYVKCFSLIAAVVTNSFTSKATSSLINKSMSWSTLITFNSPVDKSQ